MKIAIKTLNNQKFDVEADGSETIAAVKERIAAAQPNTPVSAQQLILRGKILKDTDTVTDSGIDENAYLVLMVSRPRQAAPKVEEAPKKTAAAAAAPSSSATSSSSSTSATTSTPSAPASTPSATTTFLPATPASTTTSVPVTSATPSATATATTPGNDLLTGAANEAAIAELCSMGFPRDQCIRAMRAAYNNPERAVEYLLSGHIPHVADAPMAPSRPSRPPGATTTAAATTTPQDEEEDDVLDLGADAGEGEGDDEEMGDEEGGSALSFDPRSFSGALTIERLRSDPQMLAIRLLCQGNPALLSPMLQQLTTASPELLQFITNHQQEFLALLDEPLSPEEQQMAIVTLQQMSQMAAGMEGAAMGQRQPPAGTIRVSPEDAAAIDRLSALGFPKAVAAQAYFACDKNEEIAANYLFENGQDLMGDDEDMGQ
jgi:UV excision repair protein RAD23